MTPKKRSPQQVPEADERVTGRAGICAAEAVRGGLVQGEVRLLHRAPAWGHTPDKGREERAHLEPHGHGQDAGGLPGHT